MTETSLSLLERLQQQPDELSWAMHHVRIRETECGQSNQQFCASVATGDERSGKRDKRNTEK